MLQREKAGGENALLSGIGQEKDHEGITEQTNIESPTREDDVTFTQLCCHGNLRVKAEVNVQKDNSII